MFKKIILAAAIALPSLAFAAPHGQSDIVIRVNSPVVVHDYVEYRPHAYRQGRNEQRQLISWIDQEQAEQRDRVIQGVRSGELTPNEAHRLQEEQAQIRYLEQRYEADHYLSQREFDKLQEELRESSRNILAQKHDREDRDDYHHYSRR